MRVSCCLPYRSDYVPSSYNYSQSISSKNATAHGASAVFMIDSQIKDSDIESFFKKWVPELVSALHVVGICYGANGLALWA